MSIQNIINEKINSLNLQNKKLDEICQNFFSLIFIEESSEETDIGGHAELFNGMGYKSSGLREKGKGIPMHNMTSIFAGGGYRVEGIRYYKAEVKEKFIVNSGDLIVLNTYQRSYEKYIGFPAVIPNYFISPGIITLHLLKISPNKYSYLNVRFLYYLLMTQKLHHQIISATNGTAVYHVFLEDFKRIKFNLPSREKVEEFTSIVDECWNKKEVNYFQLDTLYRLKAILSGEAIASNSKLNNTLEKNIKPDLNVN